MRNAAKCEIVIVTKTFDLKDAQVQNRLQCCRELMHAIKLQFELVIDDDLKPIVNRGEQEMKGGVMAAPLSDWSLIMRRTRRC
jgi:hypothetical protein